jgi:glutamate carboxypeptidase
MTTLQTWVDGQQTWIRELIERLVRLESPSHDKAAVDRCGAELLRQLEACGAQCSTIPGQSRGDHIRAEIAGEGPQTLILGHFDTVWDVGQIERMPLREEDGRLYGPGIFDMKSGLAVTLLALRAVQAVPAGSSPHVVLLWTTDEEVGSGTSRRLIEDEARKSDVVLVLEPSLPGGAAKTSRKGCGEFQLTVHGIPAHAGLDPGKGASAIHELARQILVVENLQELERGITVNVGVVSGGSRPNVTAAEARAAIDVRVPTAADAERVAKQLRDLKPQTRGTSLEIRGGIDRPPLERNDGVLRLYGMARDIALSLGRDLPEGAAGGGSDGNFTAALGVPTLDGLGPQGDGAHALHEHIQLADLSFRAALLAGLVFKVARQGDEDRLVRSSHEGR